MSTPRNTPHIALADDDDAVARPEPRVAIRPDSARPMIGHAPTEGGSGYSPFIPMLLLGLAVVAWMAFQTTQLVREREQLADARLAQQAQVDGATRVRANLDALAASTQRLANAGNVNARLVIDELRRRGVSINPNPVPTPAPTPGK